MADKNKQKPEEEENEKSNKISRKDDKFTDVLTKVDARSKGSKARISEAEKEKLVMELNQMSPVDGGECAAKAACGKASKNCGKFQACSICKTKCECASKQKCALGDGVKSCGGKQSR